MRCPCPVQAEMPRLLPAAVAAALQSEYCSKYSTKADNTTMNADLLLAAQGLLESSERTTQQKARSLLTKFLNGINGSYSVSLVITATHLLGYNDYWFPLDTVPYDSYAHCSTLGGNTGAPRFPLRPEEDEEYDITDDSANDNVQDSLRVISARDAYKYRCNALDDWSPFEVAMAFNVAPSRAKVALELQQGHPGRGRVVHQPRSSMAIPQFFREAFMRPDSNNRDDDAKHAYAAFALGNFYPYDRMDLVEALRLQGATLWEKYEDWTRRKPRGQRDEVALSMLDNLHVHMLARQHMTEEAKLTAVRRADLRKHMVGT